MCRDYSSSLQASEESLREKYNTVLSVQNNIPMNDTNNEQQTTEIKWGSPLNGKYFGLPLGKSNPSGFASKKKYGYHTGVDIICNVNDIVTSVEDGIVTSITNFSRDYTNKKPWINMTKVILVEGESGLIVYGNIKPKKGLRVGDLLDIGDEIGKVMPVYKKHNKTTTAKCKLKIEWYKPGTIKRLSWRYDGYKPSSLLDPTPMLISLLTNSASRN